MSTTTDLTTLKINYLTQAQYDDALDDGDINADELYLTPSTAVVDTITTTAGTHTTITNASGDVSFNVPTTAAHVSAVPTSDVTTSGEVSKIPKITSGGVLEVRKYIDLHDTSSTLDYDVRLTAATSGTSGTGTLAIKCGEFQLALDSTSDATLISDISSLGWTNDVII